MCSSDLSGDLWASVIADMEDRRRLGIARYGTPLQPHNGRDALVDAYEEALDLEEDVAVRIAEPPERLQGALRRDDLDHDVADFFEAVQNVRAALGPAFAFVVVGRTRVRVGRLGRQNAADVEDAADLLGRLMVRAHALGNLDDAGIVVRLQHLSAK